jgi:hypothetical protein
MGERSVASGYGLFDGAAQAEAGNHLAVAVDVFAGEVIEQPAPSAYHLEETAAGVVVVLMFVEVPPKLVDTGGEDSYLYFGRTCISLVNPVVPDNLLLALGLQSQIV